MALDVLTGEFSHDTNTFSVRRTGYDAFADRFYAEAEAAIAARGNANTGIAGFLDVLRPAGVTVLHTISASAEPAGFVTDDAFDRLAGRIVAAAREHGDRIDGVALALYGAMVTESLTDGEGELLARLRGVLGSAMPIESIEPALGQVRNPRREREPKEIHQGEDVIADAAAVGVVRGDAEVRLMIKQSVDDMRGLAGGRDRDRVEGRLPRGQMRVEQRRSLPPISARSRRLPLPQARRLGSAGRPN